MVINLNPTILNATKNISVFKTSDGDHKITSDASDPWVTTSGAHLYFRISTDGGTFYNWCKCDIPDGGEANIYWFRFEVSDNSKNLITEFNIIKRE